jgi:hypothetical protein
MAGDETREGLIARAVAGERYAFQLLLELVFDPGGAARVVSVTADEEDRRTSFWINEQTPTFLEADPPARQGEGFEVEFGIDGNKRLLITARDLVTGRLTHRDYPVVKLT